MFEHISFIRKNYVILLEEHVSPDRTGFTNTTRFVLKIRKTCSNMFFTKGGIRYPFFLSSYLNIKGHENPRALAASKPLKKYYKKKGVRSTLTRH
jgi:hypothetical protein